MAIPGADPVAYVSAYAAITPRAAVAVRTAQAIKLFIDGAMGSRGGLLFEPYSDDPGNSGLLLIEPDLLEPFARPRRRLRLAGRYVHHAIGDKGNSNCSTLAAARGRAEAARSAAADRARARKWCRPTSSRFAAARHHRLVAASFRRSPACGGPRATSARSVPRALRLAVVRRGGRSPGVQR